MLTSTEIHSFKALGSNEDILSLLKNSGFDAYDFGMFLDVKDCFIYDIDYIEKARSLRKFADSIGIVCNQAHAPFPVYLPVANKNWSKYLLEVLEGELKKKFDPDKKEQEFAEAIEDLIKRSIEIAGILGAKNIVIHPNNNHGPQQNYQMYMKYLPVAKKSGVKIALENMFNWDDEKDYALPAACSDAESFCQHLDLLNDSSFVACVDVGHAEMKGLNTSASQIIRALGDRLKCLHLHDNDKHYDSHNLPFTGNVDFNAIIDALAEVNYKGDITLEAPSFLPRFEKSFYPQAVKYMYQVTDYIRTKLKEKQA